ncbi:hypothetical protein LINPERPRIM_LOCUS16503 [Linum perenne]
MASRSSIRRDRGRPCITITRKPGPSDQPLKAQFTFPVWPENQVIIWPPESQVSGIGTGTVSSPQSLSSLQCASRNLIDELSSLTSGLKSATSGSSSLLEESNKLLEFLDTSVESISGSDAFEDIEKIVVKIVEQETDPIKKSALKKILTRVAEFKDSIPEYLTMIETSNSVETSRAHTATELEAKLVDRQNQIRVLESEVSRIWEEETKLESEIKLLIARKEKMADERKLKSTELTETNQEASREIEELKKQVEERNQAGENKMTAKEKLAQSNASWKLFKEYLVL